MKLNCISHTVERKRIMVTLCSVCVCAGHEGYRDGQRGEHSMHDSPSAVSRERSSSLQGMDMASLPPRKRPWHDGPGTGDMDSPGAGPDDRGAGETPEVTQRP